MNGPDLDAEAFMTCSGHVGGIGRLEIHRW